MGKGLDIQMPPSITMEERTFLLSHLKVPEKKLHVYTLHRDTVRREIQQEKRQIVDHYKDYATERDAAKKRLERLESGDLRGRSYNGAWYTADNQPTENSTKLATARDAYNRVQSDVLSAETSDVFETAGETLTDLISDLDAIISSVSAFDPDAVPDIPPTRRRASGPPPLPPTPVFLQRAAFATMIQAERDGAAPLPPGTQSLMERERDRLDKIEAQTTALDAANTALTAKDQEIAARENAIRQQIPVDNEELLRLREQKKLILAQQMALADQLEALTAYKDNFNALHQRHQETLALQDDLNALSTADMDAVGGKIDALAQDDSYLGSAAKNAGEFFDAFTGSTSEFDEELGKQIAHTKRVVETDATTPLPGECRMFLDEADAMLLSANQAKELTAMLDRAEALRTSSPAHPKEAYQLVKLALASRMRFKTNRWFTPPEPQSTTSMKDQLDRQMKDALVDLDRFWGLGGDDTVLRPKLDALRARLQVPDGTPDAVFLAVQKDLDKFETELANARMQLSQPGLDPASEDAIKAGTAKDTARAMKTDLLKIYDTQKISGTDINKVDRALLIIIPGEGDEPDKFYRIKTEEHKGQTVPKLKNSKIPRETADAMIEAANLLQDLAASTVPGVGDAIDAAKAEADALRENTSAENLKLFEDIASAISSCHTAASDSLFATFEPTELREKTQDLARIESSYPRSNDLAGLLKALIGTNKKKPDGGIHFALKEMSKEARQTKSDYESTKSKLDSLDNKLNGKTGWISNRKNIGTAIADMKSMQDRLTAALADQISDLTDQTLKATLQETQTTIRASLMTLKDLDEDSIGYEGNFATRSAQIRAKLERKRTNDVALAKQQTETLKGDIETALASMPDISALQKFAKGKVDALDLTSAEGQQELTAMATFLKETADGATAKKEALDKVKLAETRAETELAAAKAVLDDAKLFYTLLGKKVKTKHSHPRQGEYDSLKADFKEAQDELKSLQNLDQVEATFERIATGAASLQGIDKTAGRDSGTGKPKSGGLTFEPEKNRRAAKTALASLVSGITTFGDGIASRAMGETHQQPAAAVKTMLHQISTVAALADGLFAGKFEQDLTAAKAEGVSEADRVTQARRLRETGLAQLRSLQAQVEAHPAIEMYRSNPTDGLVLWTPFRQSIYNIELALTRELN